MTETKTKIREHFVTTFHQLGVTYRKNARAHRSADSRA